MEFCCRWLSGTGSSLTLPTGTFLISCNTSECTARFMTFHGKQRLWISAMLHNTTSQFGRQSDETSRRWRRLAALGWWVSKMLRYTWPSVSERRLFFFFFVSIGWNQWCELATFQAYLNRQSSPPHWEHLGLTGSRWTRGIFSTPKDFALSGSKSPTAHVNAISHDFSGGGRLRAGGSALRIPMPLVILNGNRTSNGSSQSCTPPATQRSS